MMDDFDVTIFTREAICDRASFIGTAVIDNDDFVVLRDAGKFGEEAAHHALDVGFLVMRWEENREPRQSKTQSHLI